MIKYTSHGVEASDEYISSRLEELMIDRLIALGTDLVVNGECPFCVEPCNNSWCEYTKEQDASQD